MRQEQFLEVVSADEARRLWNDAIGDRPRRVEWVALSDALGRVLAEDAVAPGDVPSFDRSNLDGFAVRAGDTFGAEDEVPRRLRSSGESLVPGVLPRVEVAAGFATPLSTGSMIPRGADAVVPVESTDIEGTSILVRRPVVPGAAISSAGSDVARGETVLREGAVLSSRETGTLAACGIASVACIARPRVAILSTGGELIAPTAAPRPGAIHDSNGTLLSDAVREAGGAPLPVEIVPDDGPALRAAIERALSIADAVILSGGTSKGAGDFAPAVAHSLGPPGLVVHGVDLKPGKPLGLAVCRGVPVALLPGFPTSAIFTFHEFVAPLLRRLAGTGSAPRSVVRARLPRRVSAERGRTEYLLVSLVESASDTDDVRFTAYSMGKGSGSVTAFARADGFIRIPGSVEFLDEGEIVDVTLLGEGARPADLVVIGSHCTGLDEILGSLSRRGIRAKTLFVGSTAGLSAAARGECDLAPIHLLDPATGEWNASLPPGVSILRGYRRRQVVCFRPGDSRFESRDAEAAVKAALADPRCRIQNRNRGSGTRIHIDRILGDATPPGFSNESRTHHAVAAAVAQGRADFGVCLAEVAKGAGLAGIPLCEERYDFAVPAARRSRPAVEAFAEALADPAVKARLAARGFLPP